VLTNSVRSEWCQQTFYGLEHLERGHVLHIGNSYDADFLGAKNFGFDAILMDRWEDLDLEIMSAEGVPVAYDFLEVVEYITKKSTYAKDCCSPLAHLNS